MSTVPQVDGGRLLARLDELATIGATAAGGVTREAYGPLDVEARDLVAAWMAEAGMTTAIDAATNLVGRLPSTRAGARWLATGSHLDTVVDAGPLDGAYGVVAGIEAADALRRAGVELAHDLVTVAFANEEGARGTGGMVGSRALVGDVIDDELATPDDEGVPLAQRLADAGGDPWGLPAARWDAARVAAFVELHVEQGPVLDAEHLDLGVVSAITGRVAVDVELAGSANHAGTTPMALRHDALVAAAELILAIEGLATGGEVRVATCGYAQVWPNVRNVVPGGVRLSIELRDTDPRKLDAVVHRVEAVVDAIGVRRRVAARTTWGQRVEPVAAHATVLDVLEGAATRSARSWRHLTSGAGHDAQILGALVPMGMLFVPSRAGVSHNPAERTDAHHLVAGAQVLADALLELDTRLAGRALETR